MSEGISTDQLGNKTTENPWNPFKPTKRDKVRTDELASKNVTLAAVLSFFFLPAGLFYLNRGVNAFKIMGYVVAIAFAFSLVVKTKESSKSVNRVIDLVGIGAIVAEQSMAIKKARQRQQEKSASISAYSFVSNDDTIRQLKQLKEKCEANEISEEEFKMLKQKILGSM